MTADPQTVTLANLAFGWVGSLVGVGVLIYHVASRRAGNGKAGGSYEIRDLKCTTKDHESRLREVEVWQGGCLERLKSIDAQQGAMAERLEALPAEIISLLKR